MVWWVREILLKILSRSSINGTRSSLSESVLILNWFSGVGKVTGDRRWNDMQLVKLSVAIPAC